MKTGTANTSEKEINTPISSQPTPSMRKQEPKAVIINSMESQTSQAKIDEEVKSQTKLQDRQDLSDANFDENKHHDVSLQENREPDEFNNRTQNEDIDIKSVAQSSHHSLNFTTDIAMTTEAETQKPRTRV
jgi:hypothetical protein